MATPRARWIVLAAAGLALAACKKPPEQKADGAAPAAASDAMAYDAASDQAAVSANRSAAAEGFAP